MVEKTVLTRQIQITQHFPFLSCLLLLCVRDLDNNPITDNTDTLLQTQNMLDGQLCTYRDRFKGAFCIKSMQKGEKNEKRRSRENTAQSILLHFKAGLG